MSLSTLSGDVQGIILGQLRNTLEPRVVMYFSSASKELRALLTPAMQQQLRTDYEEATALCLKMGMRDCKELREAKKLHLQRKGLSAADLGTLATLGTVLSTESCGSLVRETATGTAREKPHGHAWQSLRSGLPGRNALPCARWYV